METTRNPSTDKAADKAALDNLTGLANTHRLAIFRALVRAGPDGLMAGEIARRLAMPDSSLSFHLAHLRRSGLVADARDGRAIIYRADFAAMRGLVEYLLENCCEDSACCEVEPSARLKAS